MGFKINTSQPTVNCRATTCRTGFTLVELVLYIALSSIILFAVAQATLLTSETRRKHQTITEIEQSGQFLINTLTQHLKKATTITVPSLAQTSSTISFTTSDSAKNPTIIEWKNTAITIREGTGTSLVLTPSRVVVTHFSVTNVSADNSSASLRCAITLKHYNPSNRTYYDYSKTFYASVTLRK